MKIRPFAGLKLRYSLGPVEQAQIVASTAVVVAMVTIVMVRVFSGYKLNWYDFVSVITVGIFGFLIVYFTLKYGQLLEEQKQELLALNTIAEAVNRAEEIDKLLENSLREVRQLLDVNDGWIYLVEGKSLALKTKQFINPTESLPLPIRTSLEEPESKWTRLPRIENYPSKKEKARGRTWGLIAFKSWISVPIMMKDTFSGILVLASKERKAFDRKHLDLMEAFSNQIGVALENAMLFDKLRRSEERLADLFENSPDMYHIVNRAGIIQSCNKTEANHLGRAKNELIGHSVLKLYPSSYHDKATDLLNRIFDQDYEAREVEEQLITRTGELIDVSVNTSIIRDEKNRPVFVRWVARDITEKKKLESKILHAQKIDSIGNLAGGVAHDFNNILTSILGSTAIMKRRMKKNNQWFRYAEIIDDAAKRGASLTRQLLTFARKSPVQFRPLLVNNVVESTLHLFARSTDKKIAIEKNLNAGTALINGDDGQLQQAILNLLINARDAMPEGGTITVETNKIEFKEAEHADMGKAQRGNYVVVSVADTGVGMDVETKQKIFEPFFTTKEQGKGTGLGLSVVYGVTNAHNGFIGVQSELRKGSEFKLYLPLFRDKETTRRIGKSKQIYTGDEKILVVDDEEHVGEVIGVMLQNLGYKITVVRNGKEAMAKITNSRHKYDAVILDMNMPKMGGKETFLKLKEIDPDLRIIISTGYSTTTVESSELEKFIGGFLQKPYQLEELSHVVREVLDRK